MRRTSIAAAATVVLAAAAAGATPAASAGSTCEATVRIAGKAVCLAPGRPCRTKYASRYASKGFACRRDSSGRYRLKRMKQAF